MKVIVIGNSGSGKTWLAGQLNLALDASVVHLDDLFWEPGGFDKKRTLKSIALLIEESKDSRSWIVEGVFGELASYYFDTAELFVWLDISWSTCRERLIQRGSESKGQLNRVQSEKGLEKLIQWASQYNDRSDLRSYQGHKELFAKFPGKKVHLQSEDDVNTFVANYTKLETGEEGVTE